MRNNLVLLGVLAAASVAGYLTGSPHGVATVTQGPQGAALFRPSRHPAYGRPVPALRQVMAFWAPRARGVQHVWTVGYRTVRGEWAYVYWQEGHRLILWEGGTESLLHSRRDLDLRRDVVEREQDAAASTYLLTRPFVQGVLADCRASGDAYAIDLSRGGAAGSWNLSE